MSQLIEMSLEEGENAEESLEAIAVLIDRLKDDDAGLRALSNAKLSAIGRALGPERTRDELIPFLLENTEDSDEVLSAMAGELGALVDCVGLGYSTVLLEPIEALAVVEDSIVRDKAVESALVVAAALDEDRVGKDFLLFTRRLAVHDWFTGRISACGLLAPILSRAIGQSARTEARQLFARLCRDDTPMVRRVAATKLGEVARHWRCNESSDQEDSATVGPRTEDQNKYKSHDSAEPSYDDAELEPLISLFRALADDEQDSVRLQSVSMCVPVATCIISSETRRGLALPAILKAVADRSWRVRYSVATHLDTACSALHGCQDELCSVLVELLNDAELEVRVAAANKAGAVALALKNSGLAELLLQKTLLPAVEALANDVAPQVRSALAAALGLLARAAGSEYAHSRLFPLILSLLQDSSSEVRLALISHLAELHDVLGNDVVAASLIPAVVDLARDSKWRVRAAVIARVPQVAAQLRRNNGGIDERLCAASLDWLQDDVDAIRELAAANLCALATLMGPKWSTDNATALSALCDHSLYVRRLTALKAIKGLAHLVPSKILAERLLAPVLRLAATDKVPNVRFNAIVALPELAAALKNHDLAEKSVLSTRPYLNSTLYYEDNDQQQDNRRSVTRGEAPVVGDKRNRRYVAASDDDDDGDITMAARDSDYDAAYAHLVVNDVLPTLQHIATDDADPDVREFASEAKKLISSFS